MGTEGGDDADVKRMRMSATGVNDSDDGGRSQRIGFREPRALRASRKPLRAFVLPSVVSILGAFGALLGA
eukprot:8098696-Pyramimonas_sp.AAC.1